MLLIRWGQSKKGDELLLFSSTLSLLLAGGGRNAGAA